MEEVVIAIDPGAKGATAVRFATGGVVVYEFESEIDQKNYIAEVVRAAREDNYNVRAIVEHVDGFMGNAAPGNAMFNFGKNYGIHLGILMTLEVPTELVRPSVWQKGLPKTPKLASKAAAKAQHKRDLKDYAARLFPYVKVTLANADALLLLNYTLKNK